MCSFEVDPKRDRGKMVRVHYYGKSDSGLVRKNNEDFFLANWELGFAALADGMGGAAAGELASGLFINAAVEVFSSREHCDLDGCFALLKRTFETANRRILDHAIETPKDEGLGCTGELLTFFQNGFALAHVGDSRTYLFRERELRRLTHDHSLVQELVNRGAIKPEEARHHNMRHVILRALGQDEKIQIEFNQGEALPGDIFLLCSDGLTDMIEDEKISEILSLSLRIDDSVQKLIDAAMEMGGHDNTTVVLCQVVEEDRFLA